MDQRCQAPFFSDTAVDVLKTLPLFLSVLFVATGLWAGAALTADDDSPSGNRPNEPKSFFSCGNFDHHSIFEFVHHDFVRRIDAPFRLRRRTLQERYEWRDDCRLQIYSTFSVHAADRLLETITYGAFVKLERKGNIIKVERYFISEKDEANFHRMQEFDYIANETIAVKFASLYTISRACKNTDNTIYVSNNQTLESYFKRIENSQKHKPNPFHSTLVFVEKLLKKFNLPSMSSLEKQSFCYALYKKSVDEYNEAKEFYNLNGETNFVFAPKMRLN